jgi:hypothetical protein
MSASLPNPDVPLRGSGQANIDRLANVAAGVGGNLDVSI